MILQISPAMSSRQLSLRRSRKRTATSRVRWHPRARPRDGLTDLIGSLCDLTSGSGDKGTPIIYIQGYFDNYTK